MFRVYKSIMFILSIGILIFSFQCSADDKEEHIAGYKQINDIEIYYESFGAGSPVIVLHGGPGLEHSYMQPAWNKIAPGHQLIFYDQRGSGKSGGKVDSTDIIPGKFVNDLDAFRETFGFNNITLVGHSWGALLAMFYTIQHPEQISSMVLVSTPGPTWASYEAFVQERARRMSPELQQKIGQISNSEELQQGDPEVVKEFTELLFRVYFHDPSKIDNLPLDITDKTARNMLPINNLIVQQIQGYDISGDLANLNIPVLILSGDTDPFPLESVKALHNSLPNSELKVLENCGHFPGVEAREILIDEITRFISQKSK